MSKYRLLIVDDEELIRLGLRARIQSFQLEDLEISEAESGLSALSVISRRNIDIALVDIAMPDMNGLELIKRAKTVSPHTQFILLSGYAEFCYAQQAISLRIRAYLNKPVSNELLREHLEDALRDIRSGEKERSMRESRIRSDLERELNVLLAEDWPAEKTEEAFPVLYREFPGLFSGTAMIFLSLIHISKGEASDAGREEKDAYEIRNEVKNTFEKAINGCGHVMVNSYQNPHRIFLALMGDPGSNLRHLLEQLFLSVYPDLERRLGIRVTMGVSGMAGQLNAHCANEARTALRQRYIQGRSNIFFFEDLAVMEVQPLPEDELEILRKNMERMDREGVHRQIKKLFSGEILENRRMVFLHALWVRVAGMVMRIFELDSDMFNRLISQLSQLEVMNSKDAVNLLIGVIDDCMVRNDGREISAIRKIDHAVNYIRDHFTEEIIINDLAARLDMSPGYFSSLFRKETGKTTLQFITDLRLKSAKKYLVETKLSISVIAGYVGYTDIQYFFRVFKRVVGMTPQQYRLRHSPPARQTLVF